MNTTAYTYPPDCVSPDARRAYRATQRHLHGAIRPRSKNGTVVQAPPPPDHKCPVFELITAYVPRKKKRSPSRRDRADEQCHYLGQVGSRLSELADILTTSKEEVETLFDELTSWQENLADNLKESDTGQRLSAALELLEQVKDAIEEVDLTEAASKIEDAENNLSSVEFPGMYNR